MKIDYHMHTTCSDGVFTVEQVMERALEESIEAIAITDHDTIHGVARARELCRGKARFRGGLEYTTREREFRGFETPVSIHLLGYDVDENYGELQERLERRRIGVRACYDRLCQELTALGMPVTYEEIPISCGIVMQLCDIGAHITDTFPGHPEFLRAFHIIEGYEVPLNLENLMLEEAVALTGRAGGTTVWAHPFGIYRHFSKIQIDRTQVALMMDELADLGVAGIEADYLAFGEADRQWLREEAQKRQMFCTGGSDFHGSVARNTMGVQIESEPHSLLTNA